jgi:hypothetical protein
MDTNLEHQVWLIDAEDYLARLLRLKLASWPVSLNHLDPRDLETFRRQTQNSLDFPSLNKSAVVVSLPQPGRSSGSLLRRVMELFPKIPILYLVSKHDLNRELDQPSLDGHHLFLKPMAEWDRFFELLQDVLNNSGEPSPRTEHLEA